MNISFLFPCKLCRSRAAALVNLTSEQNRNFRGRQCPSPDRTRTSRGDCGSGYRRACGGVLARWSPLRCRLAPLTFKSLQGDLKKSLAKMSVFEGVVPVNCLDGDKDKRTVCTFKVGKFLSVMAESKKGEHDVVAVTMICSIQIPAEAAKCILSYSALIAATTPEMDEDTRSKILGTLTSGLDLGNEISIATDERKYLLQKSIGLWFHVIAADGED